MKRFDSKAKISQNTDFQKHFCKELFEEFKNNVENSPFRLKTCPFSFVYSFFSYSKIEKRIAREIIKQWIDNKWCHRAKYHGLKLNKG